MVCDWLIQIKFLIIIVYISSSKPPIDSGNISVFRFSGVNISICCSNIDSKVVDK